MKFSVTSPVAWLASFQLIQFLQSCLKITVNLYASPLKSEFTMKKKCNKLIQLLEQVFIVFLYN